MQDNFARSNLQYRGNASNKEGQAMPYKRKPS
jgi:hypothetical protein